MATAFVFGVVLSLILTVAFVIASVGNPLFFLSLGILLLVISFAFCTDAQILRFDIDEKKLVKTRGIFLWSRSKEYHLADFYEIQVRKYTTGSVYDCILINIYYVELVGKTKVHVPGDSFDFEVVFKRASEIANLLEVPVAFHPSLQFLCDEVRKRKSGCPDCLIG